MPRHLIQPELHIIYLGTVLTLHTTYQGTEDNNIKNSFGKCFVGVRVKENMYIPKNKEFMKISDSVMADGSEEAGILYS
jgi:hypothetical protein